jgi:hypothetical protein
MLSLHRWIHLTALIFGGMAWGLAAGAGAPAMAFPTTALVSAGWIVATSPTQRERHGAGRAGAATLGALALSPLWFCACLAVLSEPVAYEVAPLVGDRTDRLVFTALLAASPIALWRAGASQAWSAWPQLVAAGHRDHRRATALAHGLAALVLAFAAWRSARRPSCDRPLAAATPVAAFAPLGPSRPSAGVRVHRFDGIVLRAACAAGRCAFRARPPGELPFVPARGFEPSGAPTFPVSSAVTLYRGPLPGLWVLDDGRGARAAFRPAESELPVALRAVDVAPRLAPPRLWLACAALGLALGCGLAARVRRRAAWSFGAWCEGTLRRGVITVHEAQRDFPLEPVARPADGPVVVRRAALAAAGGGYRADATLARDDVRPGTLADLERDGDAEALADLAASVVLSSFTAAPLLAARVVGLW